MLECHSKNMHIIIIIIIMDNKNFNNCFALRKVSYHHKVIIYSFSTECITYLTVKFLTSKLPIRINLSNNTCSRIYNEGICFVILYAFEKYHKNLWTYVKDKLQNKLNITWQKSFKQKIYMQKCTLAKCT